MNSLSFKTVAFMAVLCIVLGIFVARGLNPPAKDMADENSGLKQQVTQLTAQLDQKEEQIGALQHQLESPPAVQTVAVQPAVVGFEYGWRIALLILFFGVVFGGPSQGRGRAVVGKGQDDFDESSRADPNLNSRWLVPTFPKHLLWPVRFRWATLPLETNSQSTVWER